MLRIVLAASVVLLGAGAAQAQSLGTCAWSRLPAADQQVILAAYAGGGASGAARALQGADAVLRAAIPGCAERADLPKLWVQASIASHVFQLGASESLRQGKGLDRSRLDEAWNNASTAARDCTLHNAQKVFGMDNFKCGDRRAPQAFLIELELSPSAPADRNSAEQVLIYMNAKAQELLAQSLIARMPAL